MAITDSTINSSVWTEVRSKIVAAAPYVTNSSTSATTAAAINAAYNDKIPTRPQIIIHPINMSEGEWKFGGNQGRKFIDIMVDCYYKNSLGIDQMADQVEDTLKTNEIAGIELVGITSDVAFDVSGENKYHLKSITFSYDRE